MSSTGLLVAKGAQLQDATNKATWYTGLFMVYPTKITWQPQPAQPNVKEVHVGILFVTNIQQVKTKPLMRLVAGTSDYTFQFESLTDRGSAVDAYTQAKELLNQSAAQQASQADAAGKTAAAKAAPTATTKAASASASQYGGPLPSLTEKREMLKDGELCERYNTLVLAAGVLSEDEFWAGVMFERMKAAAAAASGAAGGVAAAALPPPPGLPDQRRGLSNAMLHVPVDQDGKSVAMRFNLTPERIALVFAEKPHVKRAFEKNVPNHMSEKEFWTRYLRHEIAKDERRKRLVAAASEAPSIAPHLDAPPLEHAALFSHQAPADPHAHLTSLGDTSPSKRGQQVDQEARRVRRKLAAADPTVNIAADVADGFSLGFGSLHAANKEPVVKAGLRALAEDLARDINRHATVVLAGCTALTHGVDGDVCERSTGSGPASGSGSGAAFNEPEQLDEIAAARMKDYGSGLEDLKAKETEEYEQLEIRQQQAHGNDADMAISNNQADMQIGGQGGWHSRESADQLSRATVSLNHMDPNNLNRCPVNPQDAFMALLCISGVSIEGGAGGATAGTVVATSMQAPEAVLAPALISKLRTQVKMVCDVSHHYWLCNPPTTQEQADKMARLAQHVDQVLWPEVEAALKTANSIGGPQRPAVKALLAPAQEMMEAVLDKQRELNGRPVQYS